MRRIITIASCLIVLGVVAVAFWMYRNRTGREGALAPGAVGPDSRAGDTAPSARKTAMDPLLFELPVKVAFWGDDEFSPCYLDLEHKTLYRWKDVVLRSAQVPTPYKTVPSGTRVLNVKPGDFSVVPIEAPVKYRESNGEYRPGYLDRSTHTFFEWKGVVLSKRELLDKSRDGKDALLTPDFPSQGPPEVIEIDMPAYLKDRPGLWKKS
jgi:hypothetical protein